jgi:7-cyano-7-deazaguanine synthase
VTKAVVIHSGGMDSSICLALAINEFGSDEVISLTFSYGQRHSNEVEAAKKITSKWGVEHKIVTLDFLDQLTTNALMDSTLPIIQNGAEPPNTLVLGRNGLMARLGAIFACSRGANVIYMGIMGLEGAHSGYRDCSREYMDLEERVLKLDLDNPLFEIRTPLVHITKLESLKLAERLGVVDYLLKETITCYEGLPGFGCRVCPSCRLKNQAVDEFKKFTKLTLL